MKNSSIASRTLCVLVAGTFLLASTSLFAGQTWTGGSGTTSNWSDNANWGGAQPAFGTYTFSGSTRTTNVMDQSYTTNQVFFSGTSPWNISNSNSAALTLFDTGSGATPGKIESQTTGLVTLNLPINYAQTASGASTWGEINAVSGDITFSGGTITANGSAVLGLRLYGSGHTVTFNNTVSIGTKYIDMTNATTGNTITVGSTGSVTAGNLFVMNNGVLNLTSGGTLAADVRLGGDFSTSGNQDLTKSATFNLVGATGGITFAGKINPVTNNASGTLAVNSQNTSGSNALTGNVFLDSNLQINQTGSGGALNLGVVSSANTISYQNVASRTLTLAVTGATSSITVNEAFANVTNGTDVLVTTGSAAGATTTIASDNSAAGANLLLFNPQSGTLAISAANNLGSPVVSGSGYPDKVLFGAATGSATITLAVNGTFSYGSATAGSLLGFAVNKSTGTNTAVINVSGSNVFTMNGALSDNGAAANAGNWQKSGTGTLILNANSAYTGSTTVSAGTLAGTTANAFGSTTGISLAAAGTLSLQGDSSISFVKASDSSLYSVTTSGSGATINVDEATGAGTGAKMMSIGTLGTSSTAATYTMNFTGANNTSLSTGVMTGPASTAAGSVTVANAIAGGGSLTLAGYTSANTAGGDTLKFNGTGNTTVSGAITPSSTTLALQQNGAGTTTLSGSAPNTYTGLTTVSAGELDLNKTAGVNAIAGDGNTATNDVTVSGGTLKLLASNQVADNATITVTSGAFDLSNNSEAFNTLFLQGTGIANTGALLSTSTTGLDASGAAGTLTGTGITLTGNANIGVTNAGGRLQLNGIVIADGASSFAITKVGAGQLVLGAGSTFDGGLNLNVGNLVLNAGSAGAPGAVTSGPIGTGTLTLNGGSLRAGSGFSGSLMNAVTLAADTTISHNTVGADVGLAISGATTITGATRTLTSNSTTDTTFSGAIGGASGLGLTFNSTAAGKFILSGANTYTGATTINAGTLQIGAGGTTGSLSPSSAITDNGNLTFNRSNTITQGTDFSSTGITGSGSLTLTGGGTTIFNVANTYSGVTTITGSTLQLGAATSTGSINNTTSIVDNGNLTINRTSNMTQGVTLGASGSTISGSGSFTQAGSGTTTLTAANTYTGLTTVSAGELDLNNTTGTGNAIAGDGNTATNDVTVSGGTLKWLANEQIGDTATITLNSGTVDLNGKTETLGSFINNGGTFQTGAGHLIGTTATVNFAGGNNTINGGGIVEDGHIVITGGTNTVQGGATEGLLHLLSGGAGLQMTGATLTLNSDATAPGRLLVEGAVSTVASATTSVIASGGAAANPGVVDLGTGTRTFTTATGTTPSGIDLSIGASIIAPGGALTKAGTGTMELTGANTYAGGTIISGGTLLANNTSGSATGSGGIMVNAGGTLGGIGSINAGSNNININDNGIITGAKNGTVGALTLTAANVIFGGSSGNLATYVVDISGATSDRLAITGVLNLSSLFDQITFQGSVDGMSTYVLANYSSETGTFDSMPTLPGGYALVYGATELDLVPTAVPEPGTWAAGALALSTLVIFQRRRSRRK